MKKTVYFICSFFLFIACGEDKTKKQEEKNDVKDLFVKEEVKIPEEFKKGADLIAASDCLACHKTDSKVVGPSYKDVALKYTTADIAMLAQTIIKGGSGNWGEVPMTPHPTLSEADATEMVKYILSLK